MKIGIIGTGAIGKAFARHAAKAGYEVLISNSRGPSSLSEFAELEDGDLIPATMEEAADADVVFLSLPWQNLEQTLKSIKSWDGKIVIDPSNPILPGFEMADLGGKTSSEVVAGWVSGASVVKAFNTLPANLLAAFPREGGGSRVVFYSGDDEDAKKKVEKIINKLEFAGIDLGSLAEGGKMQQFPGGPLAAVNLVKM